MSEVVFQPGDILVFQGETYHVLENLGDSGRVIPFPSEEVEPQELAWQTQNDGMRRIGNAPLPAPTPCSTGACPTEGNPVPVNFVKRNPDS